MNLEQCLRDVESGKAGKEHVDYLRKLLDAWRSMIHLLGTERGDAREWAIRMKQERDDARFAPNMALVRVQELEAELEALRHACSTEQQRLKATADMVADLRGRCGRLQAELAALKADKAYSLLVQVQELEAELKETKARLTQCGHTARFGKRWEARP